MKNLVYTVCHLNKNAPIYQNMLNACIQTLRTNGKFFGDIVVLKNCAETLLYNGYSDYAYEIAVSRKLNYGFTQAQISRAKGKHLKLLLHHFINCKEYDNILYLDIDIIAVRNINPMFLTEGKYLLYATEEMGMHCNSYNHYFSEQDMEKARHLKGANSGTFCIPGHSYEQLVATWKENFTLPLFRSGYEWDQPAFNKMIIDKRFPNKPYRDKTIYFPLLYSDGYGEETLLYHFNSKGQKEKDFNVMRSYLDLIMHAQNPSLQLATNYA